MGRCALLFLAAVGAGWLAGSATATQTKEIASYCSPSGDVCFGIFDRGGAVYLELSTAARYFGRYRLCARPPAAAEQCRSFPVFRRGATWGSTVKYGRRFPVVGDGIYRVSWKLGAQQLGPTLRFRLPLRR